MMESGRSTTLLGTTLTISALFFLLASAEGQVKAFQTSMGHQVVARATGKHQEGSVLHRRAKQTVQSSGKLSGKIGAVGEVAEEASGGLKTNLPAKTDVKRHTPDQNSQSGDLEAAGQIHSLSYASLPSFLGGTLPGSIGGLGGSSFGGLGGDLGLGLGAGLGNSFSPFSSGGPPGYLPEISLPAGARPPLLPFSPSGGNFGGLSFGSGGFGGLSPAALPNFASQGYSTGLGLGSIGGASNFGSPKIPSISTVLQEGADAFLPAGAKAKSNNFDVLRQLASNPYQSAFKATIKDPTFSPLPFPKADRFEKLQKEVERDLDNKERQLTPQQQQTKVIYESIEGIVRDPKVTITGQGSNGFHTSSQPKLLSNGRDFQEELAKEGSTNTLDKAHDLEPLNFQAGGVSKGGAPPPPASSHTLSFDTKDGGKHTHSFVSQDGFPLNENTKLVPFVSKSEAVPQVTATLPPLKNSHEPKPSNFGHPRISSTEPVTVLPPPHILESHPGHSHKDNGNKGFKDAHVHENFSLSGIKPDISFELPKHSTISSQNHQNPDVLVGKGPQETPIRFEERPIPSGRPRLKLPPHPARDQSHHQHGNRGRPPPFGIPEAAKESIKRPSRPRPPLRRPGPAPFPRDRTRLTHKTDPSPNNPKFHDTAFSQDEDFHPFLHPIGLPNVDKHGPKLDHNDHSVSSIKSDHFLPNTQRPPVTLDPILSFHLSERRPSKFRERPSTPDNLQITSTEKENLISLKPLPPRPTYNEQSQIISKSIPHESVPPADKASQILTEFDLRPLPPPPKIELPKLLSSDEILSLVEFGNPNPRPKIDFDIEPSTTEETILLPEDIPLNKEGAKVKITVAEIPKKKDFASGDGIASTIPSGNDGRQKLVLDINTRKFISNTVAPKENDSKENPSEVMVPSPPPFISFPGVTNIHAGIIESVYEVTPYTVEETGETPEVYSFFTTSATIEDDIPPHKISKDNQPEVILESPLTNDYSNTPNFSQISIDSSHTKTLPIRPVDIETSTIPSQVSSPLNKEVDVNVNSKLDDAQGGENMKAGNPFLTENVFETHDVLGVQITNKGQSGIKHQPIIPPSNTPSFDVKGSDVSLSTPNSKNSPNSDFKDTTNRNNKPENNHPLFRETVDVITFNPITTAVTSKYEYEIKSDSTVLNPKEGLDESFHNSASIERTAPAELSHEFGHIRKPEVPKEHSTALNFEPKLISSRFLTTQSPSDSLSDSERLSSSTNKLENSKNFPSKPIPPPGHTEFPILKIDGSNKSPVPPSHPLRLPHHTKVHPRQNTSFAFSQTNENLRNLPTTGRILQTPKLLPVIENLNNRQNHSFVKGEFQLSQENTFRNPHPSVNNNNPFSPYDNNQQSPHNDPHPSNERTIPLQTNPHPLSNPNPSHNNRHPLHKSPHPLQNIPHPSHNNPHPSHKDLLPLRNNSHPSHIDPHPPLKNPLSNNNAHSPRDNHHLSHVILHPSPKNPLPLFNNPRPSHSNNRPSHNNPHSPRKNRFPSSNNPHPLPANQLPSRNNPHPPRKNRLPSSTNPHPPHKNRRPSSNNPHPSRSNPNPSRKNPLSSQNKPHPPHGNPHLSHANSHPSHKKPIPSNNNPHPPHGNPHTSQINPHPSRKNPFTSSNNPHTPHDNPHLPQINSHPSLKNPLPVKNNPHLQRSKPNPSHNNPHLQRGNPHPSHNNPHPPHTNLHPSRNNPHSSHRDPHSSNNNNPHQSNRHRYKQIHTNRPQPVQNNNHKLQSNNSPHLIQDNNPHAVQINNPHPIKTTIPQSPQVNDPHISRSRNPHIPQDKNDQSGHGNNHPVLGNNFHPSQSSDHQRIQGVSINKPRLDTLHRTSETNSELISDQFKLLEENHQENSKLISARVFPAQDLSTSSSFSTSSATPPYSQKITNTEISSDITPLTIDRAQIPQTVNGFLDQHKEIHTVERANAFPLSKLLVSAPYSETFQEIEKPQHEEFEVSSSITDVRKVPGQHLLKKPLTTPPPVSVPTSLPLPTSPTLLSSSSSSSSPPPPSTFSSPSTSPPSPPASSSSPPAENQFGFTPLPLQTQLPSTVTLENKLFSKSFPDVLISLSTPIGTESTESAVEPSSSYAKESTTTPSYEIKQIHEPKQPYINKSSYHGDDGVSGAANSRYLLEITKESESIFHLKSSSFPLGNDSAESSSSAPLLTSGIPAKFIAPESDSSVSSTSASFSSSLNFNSSQPHLKISPEETLSHSSPGHSLLSSDSEKDINPFTDVQREKSTLRNSFLTNGHQIPILNFSKEGIRSSLKEYKKVQKSEPSTTESINFPRPSLPPATRSSKSRPYVLEENNPTTLDPPLRASMTISRKALTQTQHPNREPHTLNRPQLKQLSRNSWRRRAIPFSRRVSQKRFPSDRNSDATTRTPSRLSSRYRASPSAAERRLVVKLAGFNTSG